MRHAALPLVALALAGCASPAPATPDATVADAAPSDVTADVAPDVAVDRAPTLAPERAPEALAAPRWMVGNVTDAARDPVRVALERGTFALPAEGVTDGVDWTWEDLAEDGSLPAIPGRALQYAATELDGGDEGRHCFGRFDRALGLWLDGAQLPGDVYGSGRIRVPVALRPGRNLLVVRSAGGRGPTQVQLWCTPDEVRLNTDDVTAPDLLVGDRSERWLGVALLTLGRAPAGRVVARVTGGDFAPTEVTLPSLAAASVTQVPFRLVPREAPAAPDRMLRATLRVESPSWRWFYERTISVPTVAAGATHRRTFRSGVDGSVQYYGVVPPTRAAPPGQHALVLSLHGAGVEGIGQARAYSAKDWAWIVAPTNRRPFGFDWEAWGRLDGMEALDDATRAFQPDPARVYVTGHSMGGHGTWQLGTLFPGRFATLGPSAGWASFYSYTGRARPRGAFARSQASSDTTAYLSNLARRGVYAIHGTADDNVPIREGRALVAASGAVTMDVQFHEEPGAGHWWDGMRSAGADCVDWPPLFDFMRARRLDPTETDFRFTTPSPAVNPRHSFVTVRAATNPTADVVVTSRREGESVTLTTTNARGLVLDGTALRRAGARTLTVDGRAVPLVDGPVPVGPQDGKRPGQHGPLDEAMRRPWCAVYPDEAPARVRDYVSFLVATWSVIGNGHACALPLSQLTPAVRAERSIVYVGVPRARVPVPASMPFTWDDAGVSVAGQRYEGALAFVFPEGDGVSAAFVASRGSEWLLQRVQPFTSAFVAPDWMTWTPEGLRGAGFFDATWQYTGPVTP